jgi:hypothetical protein
VIASPSASAPCTRKWAADIIVKTKTYTITEKTQWKNFEGNQIMSCQFQPQQNKTEQEWVQSWAREYHLWVSDPHLSQERQWLYSLLTWSATYSGCGYIYNNTIKNLGKQ